MAKVSIIIPVYNTEKYLKQCMESILCQTLKDIEIICVDDGSTDGSSLILDLYAAQDCRIKVIHKENAGIVSARKTGLIAASGEYIGYVDSDDWIEPVMYEYLYEAAHCQTVDVAMCGTYEDSEGMSKTVYHRFDEGRYDKIDLIKRIYPNMIVNKEFFMWGIFPSVCNKIFRRDCLEKFQLAVDNRLTMGEDAACTYPCILNAESIYILHNCLYHYRQSNQSMVRQCKNVELERRRFNILYHSVLKAFEQYKDIYDLREQWRDYVLFLMVPRADILYHNIEKLDYLFPFPHVKKGSNIVIYGMGLYGQRLYEFIQHTGLCNVVAAVDRNFIELQKQGLKVVSPDDINNYEYDFIVIASSFAEVRNSIYYELINKYPASNIYIMDENLIKSESVLKGFGLI